MWNDFPSVEAEDDEWEIPEYDQEWNQLWQEATQSVEEVDEHLGHIRDSNSWFEAA